MQGRPLELRHGKPVWAVGLSSDGKTCQFKGGVAEAVGVAKVCQPHFWREGKRAKKFFRVSL